MYGKYIDGMDGMTGMGGSCLEYIPLVVAVRETVDQWAMGELGMRLQMEVMRSQLYGVEEIQIELQKKT